MTMKNRETQWVEIIRGVTLSQKEREGMRLSLIDFMNSHPVREGISSRLSFMDWDGIINIKVLTFRKSMILGLIIALVMGGSVSYASESTLPGDTLYPIKVYVNENVREALAFSAQAKAQLAVDLANRRLEEAGKLAVKGDMNTQLEQTVNAHVEQQIKDAQEKVMELKAKDATVATEVGVDLGSVLSAHSIVLQKAQEQKQEEHNEGAVHSIETLSTIVAQAEQQTGNEDEEDNAPIVAAALLESTTSASVNTAATSSPQEQQAAQGKEKAAQNKLAEAAKKIAAVSDTNQTASTTAEVRFAQAQAMFAQGETTLAAGAYGDAFKAFKQTIRLAQEAKLLANLQDEFTGEFKVDLHEGDQMNNESQGTTTSENNRENKKNEKRNTTATSSTSTSHGGLRIKGSDDREREDIENGENERESENSSTSVRTQIRAHTEDDDIRINVQGTTSVGF